MDDNESEDTENDEDDDSGNDQSENETESDLSEKEHKEVEEIKAEIPETVTVKDFLTTPSTENFVALGSNRAELILKEMKV